MRTNIRLGLQVLRNIIAFLESLVVAMRAGTVTKQVEELQAVLGRLSAQAKAQESADVSFRSLSAQAQLQSRSIRRELIRPVTQLAGLVLPPDAEIRGLLEQTKPNSYEKVIIVASSLADRTEPQRARLVEAGLRDDVFELLRTSVIELQATLVAKSEAERNRVTATAAMKKEYRRAKQLVRYIDTMVRPVFEKTPERLAEWETVANFAPAGRAKKEVVMPTVPVVQVPVATERTTDGDSSSERHAS
jgi:hypothetical protein